MAGWVKLHRKFLQWQWFSDSHMVHLFLYMLIEANHEPRQWMGMTVNRGQLVFGRKRASERLGITEQSIRTAITRLKSTSEITTKPTNKFTLITIVNWDKYQLDEDKSTTKTTSKLTNEQPTTNQQLTTPKEYKELKNNKRGANFEKFLELVNSSFSKNFRPTKSSKTAFHQAINIHNYSPQEIKAVILALKDSEYHAQNKYLHCTPDFVLRQETIEKYKPNQPDKKPDMSQWNDFYDTLQNPLKALK